MNPCKDATQFLIRATLDKVVPHWELRYPDGQLYLARYVLAGEDCLENHDPSCDYHIFLHHIAAPDADRGLHNHPWEHGISLILSGGYTEQRQSAWKGETDLGEEPFELGELRVRRYGPGDFSILMPHTYHRIMSVLPNTKTLFLAGREVSDWGFLLDGKHVPHKEYFSLMGGLAMKTVRVR